MYKLSHFFTKLYIAISRAKHVLFIVDTTEGYNKFWKYFIDKEKWEFLMRELSPKEHRADMGRISQGNIQDFARRLADNYKPKEYAETLFKLAVDEENRDTMQRALSAYKEAKCSDKASLCEAYIYKFDRNYEKAGELFLQTGNPERAIQTLWEGHCWTSLLKSFADTSFSADSEKHHIYKIISQYMNNEMDIRKFVERWDDNKDAFQDNIQENIETWSSLILGKLEEETRKLEGSQITSSFLKTFEDLSKYVDFYDQGMQLLQAELHFKRATFINKNVNCDSRDFKPDSFKRAIDLWNTAGKTDHESYKVAKKLTSTDISDRIKWMDKLGESSEIVKKYSSDDIAKTLTVEAQGIVFSCLVSKDYARAIQYPFPSDTEHRWKRLYDEDSIKFLTDVVLEDFSENVFYFMADRIGQSKESPFTGKLPAAIFKNIFDIAGNTVKGGRDGHTVEGAPYWTCFVNLKNEDGHKVFWSSANTFNILDALSDKIRNDGNSYNKNIASCFLLAIFGKDYSKGKADKYRAAISRIFEKDVFFKEDFRNVTGRNKYYTQYEETSNETIDTLKSNVREYVKSYLAELKKVTARNEKEVKALLRAVEICAVYQGSLPDYDHIAKSYKELRRESKFAFLKDWITGRMLFNQLLDDSQLQKADTEKFLEEVQQRGLKCDEIVSNFSKEDAAAFIVAAYQQPKYDFAFTVSVAKLIYAHQLSREIFKPLCRVNDLMGNLTPHMEFAIDEVLADKKHVDEYVLKLLAFTWEAFYGYAEVARNYDKLIEHKRLARLGRLLEYLKKRALLHYSRSKKDLYNQKQQAYGIYLGDNLPAKYPDLKENVPTAPIGISVEIPTPDVRPDIIEMARNLKKSGVAMEIITTSMKLTKDEVALLEREG